MIVGYLLIVFANDLREEGRDAVAAAIDAGTIRLRPILMTALAIGVGHVADGAGR